MLPKKLQNRIVDALLLMPSADSRAGRTALLDGIPQVLRTALTRDDNAFVDLTNVINQLDALGRLDSGERPVVIVAHNAYRMTRGTDVGRELEKIETAVEDAYGGDPLRPDIPTIPEVLVFGGTGEWVPDTFFDLARSAGSRVARLRVPRFEGGALVAELGGLGTGWLIAPDLLLTNYHVVTARDLTGDKEQGRPAEPHPADADFRLQAQGTVAWFDYHVEGKAPPEVRTSGVIHCNRELDYALLRLETSGPLAGRKNLAVTRHKRALTAGLRLNIVQCPGGGPLQYAIRNNFCVGAGKKPFQVRYLTDTKAGSSGAPVLDDNWQVVALHYGATRVDPAVYKGDAGFSEVVKYHNEGTDIHAILEDLPSEARDEIHAVQGWA